IVKADQVGFDFEALLAEGYVGADTDGGGKVAALDLAGAGIHARTGKQRIDRVNIGGRKAEFHAASSSVADHAAAAVGMRWDPVGVVDFAGRHERPDARTGDLLAVDGDWRDDFERNAGLVA